MSGLARARSCSRAVGVDHQGAGRLTVVWKRSIDILLVLMMVVGWGWWVDERLLCGCQKCNFVVLDPDDLIVEIVRRDVKEIRSGKNYNWGIGAGRKRVIEQNRWSEK